MRFTNSFATAPPPDALEEFKVASHQSDAASSLAAGANVTWSQKSGTNDIHGAAWDFLRNDKLSANGFFNNYFANQKLPYRQNQFGFYLGGPIYIPPFSMAGSNLYSFPPITKDCGSGGQCDDGHCSRSGGT